jgi:hypothetical protein
MERIAHICRTAVFVLLMLPFAAMAQSAAPVSEQAGTAPIPPKTGESIPMPPEVKAAVTGKRIVRTKPVARQTINEQWISNQMAAWIKNNVKNALRSQDSFADFLVGLIEATNGWARKANPQIIGLNITEEDGDGDDDIAIGPLLPPDPIKPIICPMVVSETSCKPGYKLVSRGTAQCPWTVCEPSSEPLQPPTTEWINHTWHFRDGSTRSSMILARKDKEYTDYIASKDTEARTGYPDGWDADGGNPSNWRGFGIPKISPSPTTSGTGGGGGSTYVGDANSCPGFAYSRWDKNGVRYCQLNNERKCDYNYPSYLTNGGNYTAAKCPSDDTALTGGYMFKDPYTSPTVSGGTACPAGQYPDKILTGPCVVCASPNYVSGGLCLPGTSATGGSNESMCANAGGSWDSARNYCNMPNTSSGNTSSGSMSIEQQRANCVAARDSQGNPGKVEFRDGKEGCVMNGAFGQFMTSAGQNRTSLIGNAFEALRSWFSRP